MKLENSSWIGSVTVYTASEDDNEDPCPVPATYGPAANAVAISATSAGADASVFGWTAASSAGLL